MKRRIRGSGWNTFISGLTEGCIWDPFLFSLMQTAMQRGMYNAQSGHLSGSCATDLPLPERRRLRAIFPALPDRCSRKRRGCIYTVSRLSILTACARALQTGELSWIVNAPSSQPPGAAGVTNGAKPWVPCKHCLSPATMRAGDREGDGNGLGLGTWLPQGQQRGFRAGSPIQVHSLKIKERYSPPIKRW